MKHKKRRRRHVRLRPIEWVFIVMMAVSSVILAVTVFGYLKSRSTYARAQQLAISTPAPAVSAAPADTAAPVETPAPLETPPITVDFDAVRETGKHVRGWIYSEGTNINYPVVYYTNNTYYLTHDYTGKHSSAGAIFFDTRVGKELSGDNLILYGHHMKDSSMFKSLLHYQKQEYYEEHPTLYLLTLDGNYRIDVFAARFSDSEAENYPVWFGGEADRAAFLQGVLMTSDITPASTEIPSDARLITLVTCAYSNYIEDAKYQVFGYLTPIGPPAA